MQWTKKKIAYNVLQLVFYGVVPLVLVFMLYGNMGHTKQAVGFKIAAPGILIVVLVFMCFKKLFITKKLSDAHDRLNKHKADLEVKTDQTEIANIEQHIKSYQTVEVVLRSVVPILLFLLLIMCCKVMEAQIVKLSGACGFILVSYLIGTVFAILDAREIHSKHKTENQKWT